MSVEARKWAWALGELGFAVRWVAGSGDGLDVTLPGLSIDATAACAPPSDDDVRGAVEGCDVVVVENLLSLPLNPGASAVVADALRGRPTVVHHHDLPWQRPQFAGTWDTVADDPAWAHVTINRSSRDELASRGVDAVTLYNRFADFEPTAYELADSWPRPIVLQPTRALARKNVPAAVRLAEALRGTYWLLGPPEDGYGPELDRVLAAARCPVLRGAVSANANANVADAYSACDVVALPSTWEGFGNPSIESALARRPLAIGDYPVARELRAFGFEWFGADDAGAAALDAFVRDPDSALLARNHAIARQHFAIEDLPMELSHVLERVL